jgi:hypothetical protein
MELAQTPGEETQGCLQIPLGMSEAFGYSIKWVFHYIKISVCLGLEPGQSWEHQDVVSGVQVIVALRESSG